MGRITLFVRSSCDYCVLARDLLSSAILETLRTHAAQTGDGDFCFFGLELLIVDCTKDLSAATQCRRLSGGATTVPQVFLNELHIGDYTTTAQVFRSGSLVPRLALLARTPSPAAFPPAADSDVVKVTAELAYCSQLAPGQFAQLRAQGLRAVVSLVHALEPGFRPEDAAAAAAAGLVYLWRPPLKGPVIATGVIASRVPQALMGGAGAQAFHGSGGEARCATLRGMSVRSAAAAAAERVRHGASHTHYYFHPQQHFQRTLWEVERRLETLPELAETGQDVLTSPAAPAGDDGGQPRHRRRCESPASDAGDAASASPRRRRRDSDDDAAFALRLSRSPLFTGREGEAFPPRFDLSEAGAAGADARSRGAATDARAPPAAADSAPPPAPLTGCDESHGDSSNDSADCGGTASAAVDPEECCGVAVPRQPAQQRRHRRMSADYAAAEAISRARRSSNAHEDGEEELCGAEGEDSSDVGSHGSSGGGGGGGGGGAGAGAGAGALLAPSESPEQASWGRLSSVGAAAEASQLSWGRMSGTSDSIGAGGGGRGRGSVKPPLYALAGPAADSSGSLSSTAVNTAAPGEQRDASRSSGSAGHFHALHGGSGGGAALHPTLATPRSPLFGAKRRTSMSSVGSALSGASGSVHPFDAAGDEDSDLGGRSNVLESCYTAEWAAEVLDALAAAPKPALVECRSGVAAAAMVLTRAAAQRAAGPQQVHAWARALGIDLESQPDLAAAVEHALRQTPPAPQPASRSSS